MASRHAKQFERVLLRLFSDRNHRLRSFVRRPGSGKAPTFDRKKKYHGVRELQRLLLRCRNRDCWKRESRKRVALKRQWHVTPSKGFGVDEKRRGFDRWFAKYIPYRNCVYVFWAGRTCKYVGRTVRGKNRPQDHFAKWWFSSVKRIDIFAASSALEVPMLECLAAHRFRPTMVKNKPAKQKWAKKCPLCAMLTIIKKEVEALFWLK